MGNISFNVQGHKNVLSKHKTTLEFTRDENLTLKGDCILGVSASKEFSELTSKKKISELKEGKKLIVEIESTDKKIKDSLSGYYNESFSSNTELVIRKSDFKDERTFLTNCNKASIDIDRKIVKILKREENKATIRIIPTKIKNIIFDFDNTLEEWQKYEDEADLFLSELAVEKFGVFIDKKEFAKQFRTSKAKFILKKSKPQFYSRDYWLKDALKAFKIKYKQHDIELLTSLYWDYIIKRVKLFPKVKSLLSSLSKKYKLLMLSDSDGNVEVKKRRIDKFDIRKYFKGVYTSDDTEWNKPNIKCYEWLINKTKIKPHETVSVGDHPETDLITAKQLGMTTIWLKKGEYASQKKYNYVDFEIDEIADLAKILKKI